jgi:hypothetical protein
VKSKTWDDAVLAEHRAHLREHAAREALDVLVADAIELPGYDVEPVCKKPKRSFHYSSVASGERPFAFIVNQRDLLFYVRLSGQPRVSGGFAELKSRFPTAAANPSGEWTVHVASKGDAKHLIAFLFNGQEAQSEYEAVPAATSDKVETAEPVDGGLSNALRDGRIDRG